MITSNQGSEKPRFQSYIDEINTIIQQFPVKGSDNYENNKHNSLEDLENILNKLNKKEIEEFNQNKHLTSVYSSDILLFACKRGLHDVIEKLLEKGFDPKGSRDMLGQTPMHYAAIYRDQKIYDLLVDKAPEDIADIYGRYPCDYNEQDFDLKTDLRNMRSESGIRTETGNGIVADAYNIFAQYTSNPGLSNLVWHCEAFANLYSDDTQKFSEGIKKDVAAQGDNAVAYYNSMGGFYNLINNDQARIFSIFNPIMREFCNRRNKKSKIQFNFDKTKKKSTEVTLDIKITSFEDLVEACAALQLGRYLGLKNINVSSINQHFNPFKNIYKIKIEDDLREDLKTLAFNRIKPENMSLLVNKILECLDLQQNYDSFVSSLREAKIPINLNYSTTMQSNEIKVKELKGLIEEIKSNILEEMQIEILQEMEENLSMQETIVQEDTKVPKYKENEQDKQDETTQVQIQNPHDIDNRSNSDIEISDITAHDIPAEETRIIQNPEDAKDNNDISPNNQDQISLNDNESEAKKQPTTTSSNSNAETSNTTITQSARPKISENVSKKTKNAKSQHTFRLYVPTQFSQTTE